MSTSTIFFEHRGFESAHSRPDSHQRKINNSPGSSQAGCHGTRWARARARQTALRATTLRRNSSNSRVLSTVIVLNITLTHCNALNTGLRSNTTTLAGYSRPTTAQKTLLTASILSLIPSTMACTINLSQIFPTRSTRAQTVATCGSSPASAAQPRACCCYSYLPQSWLFYPTFTTLSQCR